MNVYFLSLHNDTPKRGYWDYAIIEWLFSDLDKYEVEFLPSDREAVVVIPARSHSKDINAINKELSHIGRIILFIMGDEEHIFPIENIKHENIIIYVQNPQQGRHDNYRRLGCGWTPELSEYERTGLPANYAANFCGQVTHSRRVSLIEKTNQMVGVYQKIHTSAGFTQGLPQKEYYKTIEDSAVTYCPSGPVTPDTFRVYEALELGSVPIADTVTPDGKVHEDFWKYIFGTEYNFYTYKNTSDIEQYVQSITEEYPKINNRVIAKYLQYKRKLLRQFNNDIQKKPEKITYIIPTSPLPRHPKIDLLEEVIKNIRYHDRVGEILITFDGIRTEYENMRVDYEEYIRQSLVMIKKYGNVTPYIFDEHLHQVKMMREIINEINTEYILYSEHDTPLVIDEPIDWNACFELLDSQKAHTIRFHFEGVIPTDHYHLMIGVPEYGFQRTIQWSQRPHLTRTSEYKRMLETYFTPQAKCFLEDKLHGVVQDEYNLHKMSGWNKFKLWIYHPNTGNIKRSYHTDGRAGADKLDDTQVW